MNNELYHFNHSHDRLGRFSSGRGGGASSTSKSDGPRHVESVKKSKLKREYNKKFSDKNANSEETARSRAVHKKIADEFNASKEAKNLKNLNEKYKSGGKYIMTRKEVNEYNATINAAQKKYIDVGKKYAFELAGANLKDLGYEDTASGREYLMKALGVYEKISEK